MRRRGAHRLAILEGSGGAWLARLVALALGAAVGVPAAGAADWNKILTDTDPGGRTGHALATLDGEVFLFGGLDELFVHNDLWRFDGAAWVEVTPVNEGPIGRTHGATWVGETAAGVPYLGLFGGTDRIANYADVWHFDPAANAWSEVDPGSGPPTSVFHRAIALADRRVVMIGVGAYGVETWVWDEASESWSHGADSPLDLRASTAWTRDGETVMVAAVTGADYAYDPEADAWTTTKAAPEPTLESNPRRRIFATLVEGPAADGSTDPGSGRVWMMGGESEEGDLLRDAWVLDRKTGAWSRLPDMPEPLSGAAAALVGTGASERVIAYGGLNASGSISDSTYELITGDTIRLNNERFILAVDWRTASGGQGLGTPVGLTADTGYYWFFNPDNVEVVVKVLDACAIAGRYWVFAAGLTNVETSISVTDAFADETRLYTNPLNTPFAPLQDTAAFATCEKGATLAGDGAAPPLALRSSGNSLYLNDDRFKVTVWWETSDGGSGYGKAVELTDDTGYFWFFNEANVEVVIKVLDACGVNSAYWVFAAGLTNVEAEITVEDLETGASRTYTNPQGTPFAPIQDTAAFATCP